MRITQSMMTNSYMSGLNKNAVNLNRAFNQMTSEKRIFKLSDDPIGMGTSLAARSHLKKMEQYKNNINNAKSWLDATEDSLTTINEVIKNAYERTVNMSNGTNNQEGREAAAIELEQLRDQIVSQLNSKYNDRYLFGGYNVGIKPIEYNAGELIYNGININDTAEINATKDQRLSFEIASGEVFEASVSGLDVLRYGDTNIVELFDKAINELRNPSDPFELNIAGFLKAQDQVLRVTQQIGSKQNHLDLVLDKYGKEELNYKGLISNIEEMDLSEASVEYAKAQSIYQAALSVGAKIMQPSLLDYL